ncbi:MAG: redoxin domain-containing protein [Planctomycetes bacterium]|nr:redoxin domain-containing protein [Planctomycetota bacterium]
MQKINTISKVFSFWFPWMTTFVSGALLMDSTVRWASIGYCSPAEGKDDSTKGKGLDTTSRGLGEKLKPFELTDTQGREWKSDALLGTKGTVIAFLGTQCPLAKQYTYRLNELEQEFRDQGIRFVAIDANAQDSLVEMAVHVRRFGMEYPFLKDPSQDVADHLGVTRTPEVCVIDADHVLRYRGRIDDQYGIGFAKEKPVQEELRDAVRAILESKEVVVATTLASGCLIGRVAKKSTEESARVTYAEQVSRILQARCVSCHRDGDIGPMDLSRYEDAAAWADMIVEVTQDRRMPPWHASPEYGHYANDRSLSDDELKTIEAWVRSGAPRGNPETEPKPLHFTEGWLLPRTPDIILPMRDKPFDIPAKGDVRYQYFLADLKNTENLWVNGMELVPGNREIVHHILVFVREKGSRRQDLGGARSFLVGYVPGTRAEMMPEGYAKRIPANSELIFQVHYTPNGIPQQDLSKVGFIKADPATITHEVITTSAVNPGFRIPPGEANYRTTAMLPERLPECELLSLSPHMHVRGKSFRYTLVYPDKRREILLDVPHYDFNWQTEYRLKEKMALPKGTKVFCEAVFDNSADNLNNPDPKSWVKWGDQTYEEMMIGYFHYAVARQK